MEQNSYKSNNFISIFLNWHIQNFSFSEERSYCLRSSAFYVQTSIRSKWYLAVEWNPSGQEKQTHNLKIILVRQKYDKQPNTPIRCTVQFCLNQLWLPGVSYMSLSEKESLTTKMCVYEEQFHISCTMMMYSDEEPMQFKFSLNDARDSLLMPIYQKQYDFENTLLDFALKLPHGVIRANKNILYSRSSVFRKLIDESSEKNSIVLKGRSLFAMQQLVLYLHTNKLDFVTDVYLVHKLHSLAIDFEIQDLINLLTPFQMNLSTEAGCSKCCDFTWEVKNFSMIEPKKYVQSPKITSTFSEHLTWCMKIYQTEKTIGIFVQMLEGRPGIDVNVEIYAINVKGEKKCPQLFSFPFSTKKLIAKPDFIVKDVENNYKLQFLVDDTLKIRCSVTYSDLKFIHTLPKIFYKFNSTSINPMVDDLCQKMADLRIADQNSNLIVRAGGRDFHVHEAVLRARSSSFASLIDNKVSDERILQLDDISESTMESLLHYIYNVKLNVLNYNSALDIYKTTFFIDVHLLREISVFYLHSNVNYSNVCSIFLVAYEHDDSIMRNWTLSFICANVVDIMMSEKWKELNAQQGYILKREVSKILSEKYRTRYPEPKRLQFMNDCYDATWPKDV